MPTPIDDFKEQAFIGIPGVDEAIEELNRLRLPMNPGTAALRLGILPVGANTGDFSGRQHGPQVAALLRTLSPAQIGVLQSGGSLTGFTRLQPFNPDIERQPITSSVYPGATAPGITSPEGNRVGGGIT